MTKSVFFRRIITLMLTTIFMIAALASILFYLISRNVFYQQKQEDIMSKADTATHLLELYYRNQLTKDQVKTFLQAFDESTMFYYNTNGELILDVVTKTETRNSELALVQEYENVITPLLPEVFAGNMVKQTIDFDRGQLIIGQPVYGQTESENILIGALFICTSMNDVNAARDSMYITLLISISIVSVIALAIATFASRSISRPVTAMSDIADRMARGNFAIQADEEQPLELGELAHSLNFLSSELSSTISELVSERNRLQQVLDGLSEGILALDQNGNIIQINPAMELFFGELPEESTKARDYIDNDELWDDFAFATKNNTRITHTFPWDERIIRVDISTILNDLNINVGTVGLFHDITEAERLEQTRREYVANVSHELKTPVSAMMSLSETLSDGLIKKPEDQQRYYGYLLHESKRLSRLIDDLLELSRLQSGNMSFPFRRVDIAELLWDMVERYKPVMCERGIQLHLDVSEDCPLAYGNEDRIEQILVVLLDNASKFTSDGGSITISATWDDAKVTLGVCDTGSGIEPSDLPHVFERFYKADKAHTGSGTGLGLSISSELLSLMGEKIWVESELGIGTQFYFTVQRYNVKPIDSSKLP